MVGYKKKSKIELSPLAYNIVLDGDKESKKLKTSFKNNKKELVFKKHKRNRLDIDVICNTIKL